MAKKEISGADLIDVLNAKKVWSFRQESNPNRVTNSFLAKDGSRYFLTRVQTGQTDEATGKPEYIWAIGNKFRPIQETVAAKKVDKTAGPVGTEL